MMYTRNARLAQETGATLLSPVPPILQLPTGAFPFKTLPAFNMLNVASSNEVSIRHYDPATRALLGNSLIGSSPANNVSSLDVVGSFLVGGDEAADCLWWIDPAAMAVSLPATPMGAHVRDVIACGNYLCATSDAGGWVKKVDPATRSVVDTLALPGAFRGAYDGQRYLYVALNAANQLVQIDLSVVPMVVTATWSTLYTPPGAPTTGHGPWSVECNGDYVWTGNEGAGAAGSFGRINPRVTGAGAVKAYSMGSGNALHSIRCWRHLIFGADANANCIISFNTLTEKVDGIINTGPNTIGIGFDNLGSLVNTCGNNNTIEFRSLESLF